VSHRARVTDAGHAAAVLLFLTLAVLSSAVKLDLPLPGGGSTLSISYVMTIAAMLVLGPWLAAPIAAASAWAQCNIRVKRSSAWYQSLFSVGTLALSVAAAGALYNAASALLPETSWAAGAALVAAATVYFLLNTGLISAVISIYSGDRIRQTWVREYFWSAPSYYVGAVLAMLAVEATKGDRIWWAAVLVVPAYLTFRSYGIYTKRLAEEQRQVRQMSDVQMAIVEALATAIEAKDGTSTLQAERIRIYSEGLAQAASMADADILGVNRRAAARHRPSGGARHILSKEEC
jgi:hypothetical protein